MAKPHPSSIRPPQDVLPRGHGARIAVAAVVTVVVAALSVLVVLRGDRGTTPGALPTTTGQVTTTSTPAPAATGDLAAFLSAAATLDERLHEAATAINAAGPPWADVGPEVARSVAAADLAPLARTIPAGLPDDLRQSVVLVYSDLSSRRHAMSSFELTPPAAPHDATETLLRELGNGHAASARFDADLAETRALAARTPPVTAVPGSSRLVAEVLLLVRYVELGNGGCDARGGAVATELPEIRWEPVPWNPDADGTIGQPGAGIDFTADLRPDGTWHVEVIAC